MKNLNKVMLIGNLTRDPELKKTNSGSSVCTFSVATNRDWTDSTGNAKSEVMFHRIIAWSKLAEIIPQFTRKGSRIYVEGRIIYREYKDKEGNDRYITEIVASDVIGLSTKKDNEDAATNDMKDFPDKPEEPKTEEVDIPEPK